jgi:hypothetical protein
MPRRTISTFSSDIAHAVSRRLEVAPTSGSCGLESPTQLTAKRAARAKLIPAVMPRPYSLVGDQVHELDNGVNGSPDERERERLPGRPADALDLTGLDDVSSDIANRFRQHLGEPCFVVSLVTAR